MYNLDDIKKMVEISSFLKTKEFNEMNIPGTKIKGMKMPMIHDLSKKIFNDGYDNYIKINDHAYYELDVIHADIIAYIKDDNLRIKYIKEFIPYINNWAVLDNLVSRLKIKDLKLYKELIDGYLDSKNEFEIRFVAVMYLYYYLNDEYIDMVLNNLDKLCSNDYYASMGIAWAISQAYPLYKDKTIRYLKNNHLDNITYKRAISKMCDSYKINKDDKRMLKELNNL